MSGNQDVKVRDHKLPGHYQEFFPKPFLRAVDLNGKGWNLQIDAIKQAFIFDPNTKRKNWKWIVYFKDTTKFLILTEVIDGNIAEATGITKPADWIGQWVCVYAKKEKHGIKEWDVVRIKKGKAPTTPKPKAPAPRPAATQKAKPADPGPEVQELLNDKGEVIATRAATAVIKEHNLDIQKIFGSGANGCILKGDVVEHMKSNLKENGVPGPDWSPGAKD